MAIAPKPKGNVADFFSGSAIVTHRKTSGYWIYLSIVNDDATNDLDFTVNGITITVQPNEVYEDSFEDFSSISIDTAVAYRVTLNE
jgi:hypothetical protein